MSKEEKELEEKIILSMEGNLSEWRYVTGKMGSWAMIHDVLNICVDKRYDERRATVGGGFPGKTFFTASSRLTDIAREKMRFLYRKDGDAFSKKYEQQRQQAMSCALKKFDQKK